MSRTPLPEPIAKEGGVNFWRLRQFRCFVAAMAGLPEPEPRPDDEHLITQVQFQKRLGGVSAMWFNRRRAKNIEKERAKRKAAQTESAGA